jgi:hypothetical protein
MGIDLYVSLIADHTTTTFALVRYPSPSLQSRDHETTRPRVPGWYCEDETILMD